MSTKIGTQILTMDGIVSKAEKQQSIYVTDFKKAVSAAFLVQMRVVTLARYLKSGCFTYNKESNAVQPRKS